MKSFGTVLVDHPQVFRVRSSLQQPVKIFSTPDVFRGDIRWQNYLTAITNQGKCGNCWAIASTRVLSDRFAIWSLNQINVKLSAFDITICESTISEKPEYDPNVLSQSKLAAHSTKACYGNSIISAMQYLYVYGVVSYSCFNNSLALKKGIMTLDQFTSGVDLPSCEKVFGNNYDHCLDSKTAARYFRCINYYAIPSDIDSIKSDIYRHGPVVAGFIIYDGFLNYDATTVYTGPKAGEMPLGGHAVRIVGWDKENGIDYWIVANSWGLDWGLGGYFKMKMNIPECKLEENVFGMIPDIPGLDLKSIGDIPSNIDLDMVRKRSWVDIDNTTGYRLTTIREILEGRLDGTLVQLTNPKLLPDYKQFVAGKVPVYTPTYGTFPHLFENRERLSRELQILLDTYGDSLPRNVFVFLCVAAITTILFVLRKYK